jgi:hypothetical protein
MNKELFERYDSQAFTSYITDWQYSGDMDTKNQNACMQRHHVNIAKTYKI